MYGFFLDTLDFPTRLTLGTSTLLRGMLTVFAVLSIIWLFLVLLRVLINDLPKKRAEKMALAEKAAAPAPAPVVAAPAPSADAELVAAITAAIAAYTADEDGLSFRVVSFRRVN